MQYHLPVTQTPRTPTPSITVDCTLICQIRRRRSVAIIIIDALSPAKVPCARLDLVLGSALHFEKPPQMLSALRLLDRRCASSSFDVSIWHPLDRRTLQASMRQLKSAAHAAESESQMARKPASEMRMPCASIESAQTLHVPTREKTQVRAFAFRVFYLMERDLRCEARPGLTCGVGALLCRNHVQLPPSIPTRQQERFQIGAEHL